MKNKLTKTLTTVQDEYIATVNGGIARWSHRPDGGHVPKSMRGARRKLEADVRKLGLNEAQVAQALCDARDMALLERSAS